MGMGWDSLQIGVGYTVVYQTVLLYEKIERNIALSLPILSLGMDMHISVYKF